MTARPDRSTRRLQPWLWAVPAAAALAIAASVEWTSEVSLVRPDRAASLLVAIDKAAALPVVGRGTIERTAPDGPMPQMADRMLVVDADGATIAARIAAACRTAGFRPPGRPPSRDRGGCGVRRRIESPRRQRPPPPALHEHLHRLSADTSGVIPGRRR